MSILELDTPATAESAIAFPDLPKWIAQQFRVPKPHISTLHRWRLSGARGVALPTFLIGSRRYCRPDDVREFFRVINSPETINR